MTGRKRDEKPAHERLGLWLNANRTRFRTNASFAEECKVSEGRISQVLKGGLPSPRLALRIQQTTNGAIASEDWFKNLTAQAVRA